MVNLPMTSKCAKCGATRLPVAIQCHRCGGSIAPPESETISRRSQGSRGASERRYVTVLFADLVGFTQLSERLEPEQVTELLDVLFDRLTRVVVSKGGTIDKYIGDCVMALFGAPRAYGDDAERACSAALAMQRAAEEISRAFAPRLGAEVRLRIGIHGGRVIAGFIGGQGFRSYTVIGDAVNVAQRIESKAAAGGILLSDATASLVAEKFSLERVGAMQMKGRQEPVLVHRLLGEELRSTPDRSFDGKPIAFLERCQEMGRLRCLRSVSVRDSAVNVALVCGPTAVGKSRLLEEFAQELEGEPGLWVLVLRAREGRLAVHEALRDVLAAHLAMEKGSWEKGLDVYGRRFTGDSPDTGRLGTGPGAGDAVDVARSLLRSFFRGELQADTDEPGASRAALYWALGLLLGAMADGKPMAIIAVDDEFLDDGLHDFAMHLVQRATGPIFVALEERACHPSDTLLGRIELTPLEDATIAKMVEGVLSPTPVAASWLPTWIASRSSGNVSIAMQYLRLLVQRGSLARDATNTWIIAAKEPDEGVMPATVEATFQAMLDGHDTIERDLLRRASAFGNAFWDELLIELCEDLALRDVVLAKLQRLRLQGVIASAYEDSIDGARPFRFVSREFQQTCYRSLTARDARSLHATIARALEHRGHRVRNPTLIAEHLLQTDDVHGAGVRTLELVDERVANLAIVPARSLLDRLEDMVTRVGIAMSPLLHARMELSRADVDRVGGLYESALAHIEKADGWLVQHVARLAAPPASDVHRFRCTMARGRVLQNLGRYAEAVEMFTQATVMAESLDDAEGLVTTEASLAWNLLRCNELGRARAICERTALTHGSGSDRGAGMSVALARHFDTLGELARLSGQLDVANGHYLAALRLRAPTGRVHLIAHSEGNLALLRGMAGDWRGAADAFRRVLGLWTGLGEGEYSCIARLNYAEALLETHRRDEARREVRTALAAAERMGALSLVAYGRTLADRID